MTNTLPEIILLDLDNTLYDYAPCHTEALDSAAAMAEQTLGMAPDVFQQHYNSARRHVHERLGNNASSHNRLLYFQRLIEISGNGIMPGLALKLYELYWDTFIESIVLFDGVNRFLEYAKKLDISVVLVTDLTADVQFKKIDRLSLDHLLDAVVTSEEAGSDKPDAAVFSLALEKSGRTTDSIWMIGDNPKKDIQGGKAIGAVTFLKIQNTAPGQDPCAATPDYTFESFNELTDILKELESNAGKQI